MSKRKADLILPSCPPNCQAYHNREQAAALLCISLPQLKRLESKGLKHSGNAGDPRYWHPDIVAFMQAEKLAS